MTLLLLAEFSRLRWANVIYDPGLAIAFIPLVAAAGDRGWPQLILLPVTLLPIVGKTVRRLVHETPTVDPIVGWIVYAIIPLAVATAVCVSLMRRPPADAAAYARPALLTAAWTYFLLNFAFFDFPWPWQSWTVRTPNALAFAVCVAGLTLVALRRKSEPQPREKNGANGPF